MNRTLIRRLSLVVRRPIEKVLPATGQHRARPVLLPDEPFPASAGPVRHAVVDEAELEQLLDDGVLAVNRFATCPSEGKRRFHSFDRMGVRRCWTCGASSAGDAVGPALVRGDS